MPHISNVPPRIGYVSYSMVMCWQGYAVSRIGNVPPRIG